MILANKQIGETPLELIDRLRAKGSIKEEKATYAGRLDPLAEGLMIILTGNEVHDKQKYLNLDKTYEVKFLFGIATDTYDPLGVIALTNFSKQLDQKLLEKRINDLQGKHNLPYPPYSSKTVQGKPLWQWAKEGNLNKITIPTKTMIIKEITINSISKKPLSAIAREVIKDIKKVKGDFRQSEIINQWQKLMPEKNNLLVVEATIHCSSGTYIRSLAHLLGKQAETGSIALRIKRTKIGKYSL